MLNNSQQCQSRNQLITCVSRTLEAVDGIFLFTAESYEPESVAAAKKWFAEKGRPAYVCGPLLPSASKSTAIANEKKLSGESAEIQAFLDESLRTSGEKSVLYVRSLLTRRRPSTF